MKFLHLFIMIFSLTIVAGCSSDESNAKKLIIVAFKKAKAVQFVEFTRIDEKNSCYEVRVRNFDGREETAYISLKKDNANDPLWSHWATTKDFDECRGSIKP
jgi:spermidine/putrescine-binding protein